MRPYHTLLPVVLFFFLFVSGCIKPYEPPEVLNAASLLVVDGLVQAGGQTTIRLSRTRRLTDTDTTASETGARLVLEGGGAQYPLLEGPSGVYTAATPALPPGGRYRLQIQTTDGTQAESEYVEAKQTPPVEKLYWDQSDGFATIYVDTRDPQNNTRYYRWDFEETWEYRAAFESLLGIRADTLYFRSPEEMTDKCWNTEPAPNILLGASASLSEDVISRKIITKVKTATKKMGVRYSILVRQYALTREAFEYWQILQKNTEQRGTLFDAQPSQLRGNFKNLSRPEEPVIGYLSASSVAQQRIFIRSSELDDRYREEEDCPVKIVPRDSAAFYARALNLAPAYSISGTIPPVALAKKLCVDCTLQGGVALKPVFW